MSETESNSRTGRDVPGAERPASEVKTALAGFISDINERFAKQEERLTMLDRKSQIVRRPALSVDTNEAAPHQKAFAAYVRSGDDDALRGLELEGKAMSTAVAADGGYLVDPQTSETVKAVLKSTASIRQVANVVKVEATAYDVLIDHGELETGWADELSASTETGTGQLERISIPLYELSALPKVSQRLLDDSAFEVEGWLAGRIADKFARAEAASFISGNGVNKPTGFLTKTLVANASWTWGQHRLRGNGSGRRLRDRGPRRRDRRPRLCARCGIPRERDLRDELEDRRRGAQDQGCRWPVSLVGRALRRRARTASRLSRADRRGHAGHRRRRSGDRLRGFLGGLHGRRAPGPAHSARSVLCQAQRVVLRHQARGRGCQRLCRDQSAEVLGRLIFRRAGPSGWAGPVPSPTDRRRTWYLSSLPRCRTPHFPSRRCATIYASAPASLMAAPRMATSRPACAPRWPR